MDCLFCKIANKEIGSELVDENEGVIAFKDIHPKAKVHILVIPKKHINSVNEIKETDKGLVGELMIVVKKIAQELNLNGYKVQINVGREGGQEIDHLHLHLLSEK